MYFHSFLCSFFWPRELAPDLNRRVSTRQELTLVKYRLNQAAINLAACKVTSMGVYKGDVLIAHSPLLLVNVSMLSEQVITIWENATCWVGPLFHRWVINFQKWHFLTVCLSFSPTSIIDIHFFIVRN